MYVCMYVCMYVATSQGNLTEHEDVDAESDEDGQRCEHEHVPKSQRLVAGFATQVCGGSALALLGYIQHCARDGHCEHSQAVSQSRSGVCGRGLCFPSAAISLVHVAQHIV